MIETKRLQLRPMTKEDYADLCLILQDETVMYAYEGAFDDSEVHAWLERQLKRYEEDGFGLYAVLLKETGQFIGQCGLTRQPYRDTEVVEVGYLLQKAYWHQGYATEAAIACKEYAFSILGINCVYSIIRDTNSASIRVAERNGMTVVDRVIKHYRGVDMPHLVYCVHRNEE